MSGFASRLCAPREPGRSGAMVCLDKIEQLGSLRGPVALAIGVFDGIHLGHQEVIRAACQHAALHDGSAVVLTFDPHPLSILHPERVPPRLCGAGYRRHLLEELGVHGALVCPFTRELAETSAEDFVAKLVGACQPLGCISVGYAWAFGKSRSGNIHSLTDLGQRHQFAVYGVPPVRLEGAVVSSTLIREAVSTGSLEKASLLLGRPYALHGTVVEGRRLGRQLGFPTANLRLEAELLPPFGVYAVRVRIGGVWLPGVANLGVRPTVEDGAQPSLEAHVLDWQGDLYGQELEVRLGQHLRAEKKFASVEELKTQILEDARAARACL